MTDITELALREKFEAWWEREYKHLESSKYTDAVPHIKYGFWMAYQAGGAELVEALESKERTIQVLESSYNEQTEALEKAQGMEAYWKTQCRGITDHCEVLQARIAELEARTVTVKLPERYACELGYNAPDPNGAMLDRDDVIAALTAAGIKVEAE